jgi:hypothetical protein
MKERKNLAALLKPKTGEGLDAAYETTKNVQEPGPSTEENIKDIKKDIRTMSADTKVLVKEAKSSNKILKSIEKSLTQPKPDTPIEPVLAAPSKVAVAPVQLKPSEDKKEEGNANIASNIGVGALGGGVAAAGAVGLNVAGEALSNVGSRVSTFFSNMVSGNARPGLSQVLDEEERLQREAVETVPTREMFEQDVQRQQAEVNQGADYAMATQTLAAAGISPVSPEGPIRPGGRTMQPVEYEQAAQAQAAREAVQRGMRQRTRGGGLSEPRIPTVEQAAQQPESQVEPSETTQISFSEAKFAEADPENYKRFVDFRKQRYNEIKEEEKKKGFSDSIANDIAEPKARKEAIIKFRKEIEAAAAGAVKTTQKGQESGQPPAPVTTSPVGQQPVTTSPVGQQPASSRLTRVEQTSSFDAAKLADEDPETHAKFVARQREIVKEREAELEKRTDLSPMARNVERQRIQSQAFQTAAREFTPQAAQVGAATVTRTESGAQSTLQVTPTPTQGTPYSPASRESVSQSVSGVIIPREDIDRRTQQLLQNNPYKDDPAVMIDARQEAEMELKAERLKTLSAENKDLGRESLQPSTQPIVIQSNNNMSTQTYTPVPAQPRVDSSFTRHQQRNTAF